MTNAVRFGWWTGEEYGLLGSEFYVASLNETETAKIALYLNFDMVCAQFCYLDLLTNIPSDSVSQLHLRHLRRRWISLQCQRSSRLRSDRSPLRRLLR